MPMSLVHRSFPSPDYCALLVHTRIEICIPFFLADSIRVSFISRPIRLRGIIIVYRVMARWIIFFRVDIGTRERIGSLRRFRGGDDGIGWLSSWVPWCNQNLDFSGIWMLCSNSSSNISIWIWVVKCIRIWIFEYIGIEYLIIQVINVSGIFKFE